MKKSQILIIPLVVLFAPSCATTPTYTPAFDSRAKVGVINLIEARPTLWNFGVTTLQRNSQDMEAEWNIKQIASVYLGASISNEIRKVEAPEWMVEAGRFLTAAGWNTFYLKSEYKQPMRELCEASDVDLLIVLQTYESSYYGRPQRLAGYGMYINVGHAAAFASFWFNAFSCESPTMLTMQTSSEPETLRDVSWDKPMDLPLDEFEKSRPYVEAQLLETISKLVTDLSEVGILVNVEDS